MTKSSSMNKQRLVDAACRTYFLSFARQFFRLLNPGLSTTLAGIGVLWPIALSKFGAARKND